MRRCWLALMLAGGLCGPAAAEEPVTVFAAASLTDALEEVGRMAEDATGVPLRFSFASSSTLARQIEAGAGADVYASANRAWMDHLEARGLIEPGTRTDPIGNRLVLIAPAGPDHAEVELGSDTDLPALLGPDGRLAIGDPEHVPAGIYAAQALRSLGLWGEVEDRLAHADDVRAALALVARGEAPLGIVYATDARVTDAVEVVGTFPADSHDPITYPFAIVAGRGNERVRAVFAFLTGGAGGEAFERAGFIPR